MKIKTLIPIVQPPLDTAISPSTIIKELAQFKAPDTEIEVTFLPKGPISVECYYGKALATT